MSEKHNTKNSLFIAAALLLTIACSGGGGDGGSNSVDGGQVGDGGALCAEADSFTDLDEAGRVVVASQYLSVDVALAKGSKDLFVVELFEGSAPFENGFRTGTFEISGTQTDYNTCGTCVSVWANVVEGDAEMVYLAQTGTLTITSVQGRFTGSFVGDGLVGSNFVGYRPTSDTSSEKVSECSLTGSSASWDSPTSPSL